MKGVRRTFEIERDKDGQPTRMIWTGDFRRVPVLFVTCPKCPGSRLTDGRCFRCWADYRGHYYEARV